MKSPDGTACLYRCAVAASSRCCAGADAAGDTGAATKCLQEKESHLQTQFFFLSPPTISFIRSSSHFSFLLFLDRLEDEEQAYYR